MYIDRYRCAGYAENIDIEDVRLLAEMIASKETDRALDLLNEMFPEAVSVAFLKKNAEWRSGEVLF
jgi:hypothetical protein